jgi:hypothetical protein
MKVRTGFVSNSSASSFIVYYKPDKYRSWRQDDNMTATEEDYKKLIKYGFEETCLTRPDHVSFDYKSCKRCDDKDNFQRQRDAGLS